MSLVADYNSSSDEETETKQGFNKSKEKDDFLFSENDENEKMASHSLLKLLPDVKESKKKDEGENISIGDFVDPNEDLNTIPKAKTYGEKEVVVRKKSVVRLILPSLSKLSSELISEDPYTKRRKVRGTQSSIASFLPPPKNTEVTKLSFVPRSLSRTKPLEISSLPKVNSSFLHVPSLEPETYSTKSFFSLEDNNSKISQSVLDSPSLEKKSIKADPDINEPDFEIPLIGPSLPSTSEKYYDDPSDLMTDTEALERIGGRAALRNKDHLNVIEVNGKDNQPDPKVWLTKAITENELDAPGPKVTIKGVQKSRHQITYLAQLAKANEQKLKAQWASDAHNRRTSGAKYGFF